MTAELSPSRPVRLNLGCGQGISDEFVNVDIAALPGVDVVADLNQGWPWKDGSVQYILASHIFEHVNDPVHFMTEAWRVLDDDGVLDLRVPYYKHPNAFTDPTHRRFCTEYTFNYWITGTALHAQLGAGYQSPPVVFHGVAAELNRHEGDVIPNEFRAVLQK